MKDGQAPNVQSLPVSDRRQDEKHQHPGAFDSWQQAVWIGVACALGMTVLLLMIIVAYVLHLGADVFSKHAGEDLAFTYAGISLITLTLIRLLAVFFGASLSFGGLVVSYYTHTHTTHLAGSGGTGESTGKASLSTNSPGIAAILIGALVIIGALFARGEQQYEAPTIETTTTTGSGNAAVAVHESEQSSTAPHRASSSPLNVSPTPR